MKTETSLAVFFAWLLSLATIIAIFNFAPLEVASMLFPRTADIADGAIINVKLADGSVTSAKILDGTLTAVDLADGSVTSNKIGNDAIVNVKLADGSVTSAKILDGTLTAVDLADDSIITVKIEDGAVTTTKITDGAVTTTKITDGAVTNVKLAPGAIPFQYTFNRDEVSTTSDIQVDIPDTSVEITLERNSHLMITFSTEAWNPSLEERISVEAQVNGNTARPGEIYLTPTEGLRYAAYTYNFYLRDVAPGTYTVKIVWRVSGGTGWVYYRTLTVVGFPA